MPIWTHKIALVTGAGSGLGRATALHLFKLGARVIVGDLESSEGAAFVKELNSHRIIFSPLDVTSAQSVTNALDLAKEQFGHDVNTSVNCAGIGLAAKILGKTGVHSLELFQKVINVNLVGSFNVSRLAAERMAKHTKEPNEERGVIINTASVAAFDGQVGQCAYASSKAAVTGMTLPMARDLMDTGIRVVTIAPGMFMTPMMQSLPEKAQVELAKRVPFPKRLGDPSEFAHVVQFIVENGYMNGEVIRIDGSLRMPAK